MDTVETQKLSVFEKVSHLTLFCPAWKAAPNCTRVDAIRVCYCIGNGVHARHHSIEVGLGLFLSCATTGGCLQSHSPTVVEMAPRIGFGPTSRRRTGGEHVGMSFHQGQSVVPGAGGMQLCSAETHVVHGGEVNQTRVSIPAQADLFLQFILHLLFELVLFFGPVSALRRQWSQPLAKKLEAMAAVLSYSV